MPVAYARSRPCWVQGQNTNDPILACFDSVFKLVCLEMRYHVRVDDVLRQRIRAVRFQGLCRLRSGSCARAGDDEQDAVIAGLVADARTIAEHPPESLNRPALEGRTR